MDGITPLKAHLFKTSCDEWSQPVSNTWNGGRHITGSAIYSTRGRFCCHYSDHGELHALPLPSMLFLNVMLYMSDLSFSVCVCIGEGSGISYVFWECMPCTEEDETTMTVNYTVQSCNLESGY